MAQRRVPIADVEAAIAEFKAKAGPDADAKLLRAFAAAFADLSQQRSQIIDGLDRIGRRQKALADRIRAENEAVQKSSDQNRDGQAPPGADSQERLLWDIRIFDDRRQTVDLRLRGADADRTAHRGDRARRAEGSVAPALVCSRLIQALAPLEAVLSRAALAHSSEADVARNSSASCSGSGSKPQGEIGLSFSSSNGTP